MKKVVAYGIYNNEKNVRDFENRIREELANHKEWKLENKYIDKNNLYINFDKLLNATIFKDIDIILIKNIKQFYKITNNAVNFFINYLQEKRIEIVFLDEKISTLDNLGKTQLLVMLTILEEERKIIIEKSKKNNKQHEIIGKEEFISEKEKANKSRSEKMKALWNNEEYRKRMIEKIKIGKKSKK